MNTVVLEETEFGDQPVDIYTRLSSDRILFITDIVDDLVSADICATLIHLDLESPGEPITVWLNSPGGDARDVLMIFDVMQLISSPIEVVCVGNALDEASLILAAGTPGMRRATKNAQISVTQLNQDYMNHGSITDAKEILKLSKDDNKKFMEIYAKCCNKKVKEVTDKFEKRVFLTPQEAKSFGIIDNIVQFTKKGVK